MADIVTPGISSDDAAIFSLNSGSDDLQTEDPAGGRRMKHGNIRPQATPYHRIVSGGFPRTDIPNLTPGAHTIGCGVV